jgi:protease II
MDDGLGFDSSTERFWQDDNFVYWITYKADSTKPIYKRRAADFDTNCSCLTSNSTAMTVLDMNLVVPGDKYYSIGFFEPNPFDASLIAYSIDFTGNEKVPSTNNSLPSSSKTYIRPKLWK